MTMRSLPMLVLVAGLTAACGTAPTAPAPTPPIPQPVDPPSPPPPPPPAPPLTATVAGFVRLPPPGDTQPVVGARVEVVANALGDRNGAASITDDNGYFSIPALAGAVTLRVTRDGYDTATFTTPELTGDLRFDLTLRPSFRIVEESYYDCILAGGHPISHLVLIYHAGTVEAEADWHGTKDFILIQLWRGSTRLAEAYAKPVRAVRFSAPVEGGHRYELRVSGAPDMHYTLKIKRPN